MISFVWMIMEPTSHRLEAAHDARRRLASALVTSPLTWLLVVVAIVAGLRCINDGIALRYVADAGNWEVTLPKFQYLPASVEGAGYLPLAASVAVMVVVTGAVFALGETSGGVFSLALSFMAGAAAIVFCMLGVKVSGDFHVGPAFALAHLGGLVALNSVFEEGWLKALPLSVVGCGGTFVGALVYSTPFELAAFLAIGFVMLIAVVLYSKFAVGHAMELKVLIVYFVSVGLLLLLAGGFISQGAIRGRFAALGDLGAVLLRTDEAGTMLSSLAMHGWMNSPWCGCGLGAFPYLVRFEATPELWMHLPTGAVSVASGFLQLVAERGLIGMVMIALPALTLVILWLRRLLPGISVKAVQPPAVALLPLVILYLIVISFFGCSLLRADVLIISGTMAAVSVASVRLKGNGNG